VTSNKAVLVHSAAGGVGSMLLQMLKVCGFHPIVAVIGNRHKKKFCLQVGADFVIVKGGGGNNNNNDDDDDGSETNGTRDVSTHQQRSSFIWSEAERISPNGYVAIFDANGLETLSGSYEHLSRCGRLITYGFHSNLPRQTGALSPIEWVKMAMGLVQMPRFDPMTMVLESKAVAGFNLSFFADEHELIERYMKQVFQRSVPSLFIDTVIVLSVVSFVHLDNRLDRRWRYIR
jgi:NADPH:quinone reductase-like Zn-dependent oxidoreductase